MKGREGNEEVGWKGGNGGEEGGGVKGKEEEIGAFYSFRN